MEKSKITTTTFEIYSSTRPKSALHHLLGLWDTASFSSHFLKITTDSVKGETFILVNTTSIFQIAFWKTTTKFGVLAAPVQGTPNLGCLWTLLSINILQIYPQAEMLPVVLFTHRWYLCLLYHFLNNASSCKKQSSLLLWGHIGQCLQCALKKIHLAR